MICIFDLETNEWPKRNLETFLWPQLASLSWCLIDSNNLKPVIFSYLVKPKNWSISPEISAKTYLTDSYLHEKGVHIEDILRLFLKDIKNCSKLIVFESKKFAILKQALTLYWPLEFTLPKSISIQDFFAKAYKQWLIPGTLRLPTLKSSFNVLLDSDSPEEPITSCAAVGLLRELILIKPVWPTPLTIKLNNLIK